MDVYRRPPMEIGQLADKLFDREIPADYAAMWREILTKEKAVEQEGIRHSVLVFRLCDEWLALDTAAFREVLPLRKIHSVPHHRGGALLGMVNVRGRLRLAVSLEKVLEITQKERRGRSAQVMAVVMTGEDRWVFPMDEIDGFHHIDQADLQNSPLTVSKSHVSYLKGVFEWHDRYIGYLDDERLFRALRMVLK